MFFFVKVQLVVTSYHLIFKKVFPCFSSNLIFCHTYAQYQQKTTDLFVKKTVLGIFIDCTHRQQQSITCQLITQRVIQHYNPFYVELNIFLKLFKNGFQNLKIQLTHTIQSVKIHLTAKKLVVIYLILFVCLFLI